MRYIKKYRLFEKLQSEIDISLIEDIIIDFIHMGVEYDISIGPSMVLDFDKLNRERELGETTSRCIHSRNIDLYHKKDSPKSISITLFKESKISKFNFKEFKDAYNMVSDFLLDEYSLIPNYIYVNHLVSRGLLNWKYQYYENLEMLKFDKNIGRNKDYFEASQVILSYY